MRDLLVFYPLEFGGVKIDVVSEVPTNKRTVTNVAFLVLYCIFFIGWIFIGIWSKLVSVRFASIGLKKSTR